MSTAARRAVLMGAMALVAVAGAPAQPAGDATLAPVRVIGASPVPGLDVPRDRVPANVQSAGAEELERSGAPDLASFMNRRLGSVYLNEVQSNPFQPDVAFRGYTASPLLGSQQGLSVYLDGVRLNQPFGDVVSWDLIPKAAIASITVMSGSNPLFGLNTLGGALSVQTKDGLRHAGTSVQGLAGSFGRTAVEFESGGSRADGLHAYATGSRFRERGWRADSPSDVQQLFAKVGRHAAETDVALTLALARTDLHGNGLQDPRFLARDYTSVYTLPDDTRNRAVLLNLALSRQLGAGLSASGNVYYRRIRTSTLNGDLNDDALDQAVYQPNAAERAALAAAGYTGFPASGESAANTPFPKWRCIANALRLDEPAEKCNGIINRTHTTQRHAGLNAQLNLDGKLLGLESQSLLGMAFDASSSRFTQASELGYLEADRRVIGVGAFGDGVSGGSLDDVPFDTRVDLAGRTRTWSLFGSTVLGLGHGMHLTLAGRYNTISVRNRDAITPGGGPGSLDGDHRYARFNPALGLTFTPRPMLNAYAGVSQGSRAPSSVELGCADPANPCKLPNAFAGDPPLRQVVTTTMEAGLRGGASGGLAWTFGLFRSDNRDDLLFVADDAAGFGYFRNVGRTRRQGLELGASVPLGKGLTIGANYTWLDATFRSHEVLNGASNSSNGSAASGFPGVDGTIDVKPGDRIPLVPRQLLKAYADVDLGASWSFGAELLASGGSPARGNENGRHEPDGIHYLGPGRSPGYAVLNLRGEYRPARAWKVFAHVANALDRRYSTAAQLGPTGFDAAGRFEARPFPADANGDRPLRHATFLAPGAPRTVWVGVRYSFGSSQR